MMQGCSSISESDGPNISFLRTSFSIPPLKSEIDTLKQQLEDKTIELDNLTNRHKEVVTDRDSMEGQLKAMMDKVEKSDSKLSEVKAESEAFIRQSEQDQQELAMMRRRSLVGGGSQIITHMYETILMRYEKLNSSHEELRRKMGDEVEKRLKLQKQVEASHMLENGMERESFQTQLRMVNETVHRLERDLNRVREERTRIKREYSLVMSERDAVHKEMDKLQEDLTTKQEEYEKIATEKVQLLEEKEKLNNQIINLQRGSATSLDVLGMQQELYAAQRERKQALLDKEEKVHIAYNAQKAHTAIRQTLEKVSRERDLLKSNLDLVKQQLNDTLKEAKDATRWRELAFSEREKLRLELEDSKRLCDIMVEEREKLVKQLEEAVKEHDTTKETKNKILGELRKLQQRENAHSHDSAIDAGDWDSDLNESALKKQYIIKLLPQHDITIEHGYYIKYCNSRNVASGDRILTINDFPVTDKTLYEVKSMINTKESCVLQLVRQYFNYETLSTHEGMSENQPEGYTLSPKLHSTDEIGSGIEFAKVRLRRRYDNASKNIKVSYHNGPNSLMNQEAELSGVKKKGTRELALLCSEEESQVSGYTANSDPSYNVNKDIIQQPNNSLSPSSGKKKKSKIGSSRFLWSRRKKVKSLVVTSSTGGSNGGTWPRLDSPSLSNIINGAGGGRLSVFEKKRRNRPSISPNTFTPLGGHSAGHTPPTPLRVPASITRVSPNVPYSAGSMAHTYSPSSDSVTPIQSPRDLQAASFSQARFHNSVPGRKKRPVSAPMDDHALSPWQQYHTELNRNDNDPSETVASQRKTETTIVPIDSLETSGSNYSNAATPEAQSLSNYSETFVARTPAGIPFARQKSVPEWSQKVKLSSNLALPTSHSSSLNTSAMSGITPRSASRARNANSLPRPSSARPISTMPSHHNGDTRKSTTLDYRRIRMPSEISFNIKLSGSERGSASISSDRSTPVLFHASQSPDATVIEGQNGSTSHTDASVSSLSVSSTLSSRSRRPLTNDPRYVTMIKGTKPIGISIVSGGENGGIFVSRLNEHSLAAKAGLEYGDQLLEYNGVNLRNAKEEQARVIMSQTQPGDNIKFLAQYNLEKYKYSIECNLSDTLGMVHPISTPVVNEEKDERTITPDATPRASPHVEETLRSQSINSPRYVFLNGGCNHIKLAGGNMRGIYVAAVQSNEDTLTPCNSDLRIGDKILEFNSIRFDNTTLEGASMLLSRSDTSSSLHVVYEPNKFKQIYGVPGDHFYVRALFDHMVEKEGALRFAQNSILLVENTYPDYVAGQWSAWLVDEQGMKSTRGRIPSKVAFEKDKEHSQLDDVTSFAGSNSGKRLSGSGRRSFFKRKKPHRNSSRSSGDVRLHKSLSETSIESAADAASEQLGAYQVVEKYNSDTRRPVVIFGPHSSFVIERLTREHTQQFVKCCYKAVNDVDHQSSIIETYTQDSDTLALTSDLIQTTMAQFPERHVLLELSVNAIDRLHSLTIYPIILFIKYTSAKKVKESQEKIYGREKIPMKRCKEILEKSNSVERKLMSKYYGTVSINGGTASMVARKASKVVSHEHNKVLWLPAKSNPLNY